MNINGRMTRVLVVIIAVIGIFFFWKVKDRKIVLKGSPLNSQSSSNIKPLEKSELSREAISLQEAFVNVAAKLGPAVVNISSVQMIEYPVQEYYYGDPFEYFFEDFFGAPRKQQKRRQPKPKKYKQEGGGSGVIISEDGYILTNEHVIHKADEIKVKVNSDGQEKIYTGKVVGKDSRTDLAVVKINAKGLNAAPLADSDKIRVGEWVIAIGSPFGLAQTVTSGIISAVRQSLVIEGRTYKDFVQTDAAINRGNSGGPLINISGEVIGVNTAIYAPTGVFSGIGFAIPINRAKEILDDLIHKGKVVRGWLGVEIKPVDKAIMKQFKLPACDGALVNNVIPGTPADKYGIKRGDVICEFDGKKIGSPAELQAMVSKTDPDRTVKVKIMRNGKDILLDLVTGEMPGEDELVSAQQKEKNRVKTVTWIGMDVSGLTDELRHKYGIPANATGVVITSVKPDGKARNDIGLLEGDIIRSLNMTEVSDIGTFDSLRKKASLKDGVVFDIVRQGRPMYISYVSPE